MIFTIFPKKELDALEAKIARNNIAFQVNVQFLGEPFNPPGGALSQVIRVAATSAQGVIVHDTNVKLIKIDIDSGSAPNKQLKTLDEEVLGVVDGSITVKLIEGFRDLVLEVTGIGDADLSLDGTVDPVAATLVTTDTAKTTFTS